MATEPAIIELFTNKGQQFNYYHNITNYNE
jgi:hypothetical protein